MDNQYRKKEWVGLDGNFNQKYSGLTDEDLFYEEGKEEEFFQRMQIKLGKTKEEIKNLIER